MKLGLASPNKIGTDGTHNGEKRRERNRNGEVLKDLRDSQRNDVLIKGNNILIHIYDRCDEVREKSQWKDPLSWKEENKHEAQ